ncbi:MAG: 8-oxo-dGTP diphosphatase [Myxococcota bacterium]
MSRRVADVDWSTWTPGFVAAVTYVVMDGQILLIHKKRGLGAGKVNAPGGRVEPGETPAEAAVREVAEEVGLRVTGGLREVGEHSHQFVDGLRLHLHMFLADGATGTLIETDEATPFWTPLAAVPYDQMWADNRLWLPQVLAGARVRGHFVFDGDAMVDFDVRLHAP